MTAATRHHPRIPLRSFLPILILVAALYGCVGSSEDVPSHLAEENAAAAGELIFDNPWDVPAEAVGPGRWVKPREGRKTDDDLTPEQKETIRRLESIGYMAGSQPAVGSGVVVHDESRAAAGLNLYTSGHAPEAILMMMDGAVLHRWKREVDDIWPHLKGTDHPGAPFWRRAYLFDDGALLAIFEGLGMVKLDKASNVLWSRLGMEHHDVDVLQDGSIYVLGRKARVVSWVDPEKPILEDFVVELGPDGALRRTVSVLEALKDSAVAARIRADAFAGDVLHTNTIVVLDDSAASIHPDLRAGNVLVSMNNLGTIAVLDLETQNAVFVWPGTFAGGQHDAEPVANARLLMFHNGTRRTGSRIVELDLAQGKEHVIYENSHEGPFYSLSCGTVQRLPNGNTLVTESDAGRAFEFTPQGEIVWEFLNPHRAGPDDRYVATLFEVERLESDRTPEWLE